ncbi:MAG: DUF4163 domain-containing protein [Deltaproteobacteria bacterium]|nr:DUF4163 domain-containing protein [Deltaproteobacteria bacterium]
MTHVKIALPFSVFALALAFFFPLGATPLSAQTIHLLPDNYATILNVTKTFTAYSPTCPKDISFAMDVSYPLWLGNADVDADIEKLAEDWMRQAQEYSADSLDDKDSCGNDRKYNASIAYELYQASKRFVGVMVTDSGLTGGAHGHLNFVSYNYDLQTGRRVSIADFFPKPAEGLTAFFQYVYLNACAPDSGHASIPNLYGDVECAGTDNIPPVPPEFLTETDNLEKLGNLTLTAEGALVTIDPYDAWSWAEGPYKLSIPKADLIKMGANPVFWE